MNFVVDYQAYVWECEEPPTLQEIKELGGVRFSGTGAECRAYITEQSDGIWLDITQD
jgi:hypothetical protein